MARKKYDWRKGAKLDEHTKKKHQILQDYFENYLKIRCQLPQMEVFRLAVVDGFSGAGLYECGSSGSPLLLVQTLKNTLNEINILRSSKNMRQVKIYCSMFFNDLDNSAIDALRKNISPLLAEIKDTQSNLIIHCEFFSREFNELYEEIKQKLYGARIRNVLFNLDQYGHSGVNVNLVRDIMLSWKSAEAFLTFSIETVLAFISPDSRKNTIHLNPEILEEIYSVLTQGKQLNKGTWLGAVERIIFKNLESCARFVSPFSINNPDGWEYWLMHFANVSRARQAYNDVLHKNSLAQAHFGRSGLMMLSYDPSQKGQLYLFDANSRESSKGQLFGDIPKMVAETGDAMLMEEFFRAAYNETPAHSDDINQAIIENPDLEVITENGGKRRTGSAIKSTDVLKLTNQKSMFFMFPEANE